MKYKSILWIIGFWVLIVSALAIVAFWVVRVDPFFHYHKPRTDEYFYTLNNERSQNNGIVKHFDYQGIITGTSMTQCFRTTEAESLWKGVEFVKVPFAGASYQEINDNLAIALRYNPDIKIVIRGLDTNRYADDVNAVEGTYPTYLYDDNLINDAQYVFNRDVIFSRVIPMTRENDRTDFTSGITYFDEYSNWSARSSFGKNVLYPNGVETTPPGSPVHMTEEDRKKIIMNIRQNVTSLPDQYPDVTFYYFITPYGIQRWQTLLTIGTIYAQIESERTVIEEILKHKNIKLFSFNNETWITTDLNNYSNAAHYGEWINSLMLKYMYEEKCLINMDNYKEYLEKQLEFYLSFDYSSLDEQEDYENDYDAAIEISKKVFGRKGEKLELDPEVIQLSNATIIDNQYQGEKGVLCSGCLQRAPTESTNLDYMRDTDYVGFKYSIKDIGPIRHIVFHGKKINDPAIPVVCIYDKEGNIITSFSKHYNSLDNEWHQYYIDVISLQGEVSIIFHGGYVDRTGPDAQFVFSDIVFY